MTSEAQNIAIAESLGWTKPTGWGDAWPSRTDCRFTDNRCATFGVPTGKAYEHYERGPIQDNLRPIPNYHSSLDACAEFEEKLTEDDQQRNYAWYLVQICDPHEQFRLWKSPDELSIWEMGLCDCFTCASAKPNQRCEAYLRTLKLWKESK